MKLSIAIFFFIFLNLGLKSIAQNNQPISNVDTICCAAHDTTVMVFVDKDATFQGGDIIKFVKYLSKSIRYPLQSLIKNEQGKAYVSFVVDWDGTVKCIRIIKSSGYKLLDAEALRVIASSPRWTPAKNNNICVPQQLNVPVRFKNLGIINRIY